MASHPPAHCCTIGVKHEGEASGKIEMTNGIESYIARPSGNNIHEGLGILYLTDVIGHREVNAHLLADQYAANGYLCVMPDILFGDPIPMNRPGNYNIMNWFHGIPPEGTEGKKHTGQVAVPVVDKVIEWMRSSTGGNCKKVGAVGYCYGGKYVIIGLGEAGKVDVGYVAHPSAVEESELAAIKGPLSIAAAEKDEIFPADLRHKTEDILKDLSPKQPYQLVLYSHTAHGFATRADLKDPQVKFAKEQAFYQAVQWFDQWLK